MRARRVASWPFDGMPLIAGFLNDDLLEMAEGYRAVLNCFA